MDNKPIININNSVGGGTDSGAALKKSNTITLGQTITYVLSCLMIVSAGYLIYNDSSYRFLLKGIGVVSPWWLLVPVFSVLGLLILKRLTSAPSGLAATLITNVVSFITLGGTSGLGLKLLRSFTNYSDDVANFSLFEVKRNWQEEDFISKGLNLAKDYRVSDRCNGQWIKTIYEGHREITSMSEWEQFLSPLLEKIAKIKELEAQSLLEGSLRMKKISSGQSSSLAFDFMTNVLLNPMFINVVIFSTSAIFLGVCFYYGIDGVLSRVQSFFSFKWVFDIFSGSKIVKDINTATELHDLNSRVDQALLSNLRMQAVEQSVKDTNASLKTLQSILMRDIDSVRSAYKDDITLSLSVFKKTLMDCVIYLSKSMDILIKKSGINTTDTTLDRIMKILKEAADSK